jgi:hypothetical protein
MRRRDPILCLAGTLTAATPCAALGLAVPQSVLLRADELIE